MEEEEAIGLQRSALSVYMQPLEARRWKRWISLRAPRAISLADTLISGL